MRRVFRLVLLSTLALSMMTAHPSAGAPSLNWFLWEATLQAPGDGMLALPSEERTLEVSVEVSVDYWIENDDGTRGAFLGSFTEVGGMQPSYGNAGPAGEGLGQHIADKVAPIIGQQVGADIGRLTTEAARTAAENADPLNPTRHWGQAYSRTASYGSHLVWRLIGATAGAL